ncbi:MAG: DUF3576 domain-containing protein [Methylobacterium sp.]|nr:MAG: DUF3576 domain-containing protein [Methylobacterium sp.]
MSSSPPFSAQHCWSPPARSRGPSATTSTTITAPAGRSGASLVASRGWCWGSAARVPAFKATAYILGRQLRTDGIRITVFRQIEQGGRWVDQAVSPSTSGEIEDKVLARARELRSQTATKS